ncbi:VCBS repeat-containing protein [Neolewinella aurantiaca]|uniref:VCBS repeat-containing protein n=1 Tax=Neolewinella aurantiaca TaxID=2602767 RepID=A0A5C7FCJ2_9BACT|nr:VCBS repeat-containing protein [Neolewinella aurantiaca]TXF88384.1 VCBS repeat-containing protein [Neolewinella aurantiaca]
MIYKSLLFASLFLLVVSCGSDQNVHSDPDAGKEVLPEQKKNRRLNFVAHRVVDNAQGWQGFTVSDVTNDGMQDLIYSCEDPGGNYLAFRTGSNEGKLWEETIVARIPAGSGNFIAQSPEASDINGDGNVDIVAVRYLNSRDESELIWYENPEWNPRSIAKMSGNATNFSVADFDGDGRPDLAVRAMNGKALKVYRQDENGGFAMVADIKLKTLLEGMDVGDIDGDGRPDIVANGFVFTNPGAGLREEWSSAIIDDEWNGQEGEEGTRVTVADVDGDGKAEVFITRSDQAGHPLSYYQQQPGNSWEKHVIAEALPAVHTLQVVDMDLDGRMDVVTGVNPSGAAELNPEVTSFPLLVMLNKGDGVWKRKLIETDGIYNGRVADFEGDGDYDIFRHPNHKAPDLFFIENQIR